MRILGDRRASRIPLAVALSVGAPTLYDVPASLQDELSFLGEGLNDAPERIQVTMSLKVVDLQYAAASQSEVGELLAKRYPAHVVYLPSSIIVARSFEFGYQHPSQCGPEHAGDPKVLGVLYRKFD